jgi:hypothetical protein
MPKPVNFQILKKQKQSKDWGSYIRIRKIRELKLREGLETILHLILEFPA